jgi:enamine deaminase RidA (YjgF/YER057c/UK114 family)
MTIEGKLKQIGVELPPVPKPLAAYIPAVRTGNLLFVAGQGPVLSGQMQYKGKVGKELTLEQGYEAAKICALNCLSIVKDEIGSLDKVNKIVKVVGYVASAPGFNDQPKVINGASEFLVELFGEKGKHARVAVGTNELPLDIPVEVEIIVEIAS